MSSSESRQSRTPSTVVESSDLSTQRRSARTMGCVGFSIVAHAAFLAALAVSHEHVPEMMGDAGVELVAGAARGSEAVTEVSLVETEASSSDIVQPARVAVAPVVTVPVAAIPVVALPQKTPPKVVKPVAKPVVKAAAPAKVQPPAEVPLTSDDEAAPVLLANPPSDSPSSDQPEITPEVTQVEESPSAEVEETPEVAPVAAIEPEAEAAPAAVVESKTEAAVEKNVEAEAAPQAAASGPTAGTTDGSSAAASAGTTAGSGAAITGPIRNSNDLKALRGNPNPVYPARDRLARRQGTTVVLGRISADGRVTDIKLEKSSGSPSMDAASLQAFRSWRYQAGQAGWVRKPFEFRLVGDAMEVPAPLGKGLKR